MKLIYIENLRIPTEKAHGIQIIKMCESFALYNPSGANSIEVELVVPRRVNSIKQDSFEYYGVKKNFKIKKIPCMDLIPLDRFLAPFAFWVTEISFLFFLMPLVWPQRKEVIYTRDKFFASLAALLGWNVFFEAHTVPAKIFIPFLRKVKGVVVISRGLQHALQDNGMNRANILIAPDAVDLKQFIIEETKEECRRRLELPQDKKIVLYAGHLYPWKGVETLLEAAKLPTFSASPKQIEAGNYQFLNTLFIFVGGTDKDVDNFRKEAEGLDNVKMAGHRPHQEIPYWLKAADVLVLPNSSKYDISKYWTSPMKLFEYMASGRPIVASNLPSIKEVLNDSNAVLVEPDSPQGLADGIKTVLQSVALAERISEKAAVDVESYTWSKRAEKILRFLT